MPTNKTIAINEEVRNDLNGLKEHERETYNDVISRLVDVYREKILRNSDKKLKVSPSK